MKVKTLKPRNPLVKFAIFKKADRHTSKHKKVKGGYVTRNKHEQE